MNIFDIPSKLPAIHVKTKYIQNWEVRCKRIMGTCKTFELQNLDGLCEPICGCTNMTSNCKSKFRKFQNKGMVHNNSLFVNNHKKATLFHWLILRTEINQDYSHFSNTKYLNS